MSPLLTRAKRNLDMHTDDLLLSIACGVIFAVLFHAFFF